MVAIESARVPGPSTSNVCMTRFDDIRLTRIRYLRGPNLWTYRPVLEVWVDLGRLEDFPSNLIDGLTGRLTTLLPALVEHHCGVGERGGFIQRLNEGTWAGHVLEHVVIELLNLAGMPTGFGQTRSTARHGVYRMVFRARDEQVARVALAEGHRLLMAAINDTPFTAADVQSAVDAVRGKMEDCYLGPSTAAIVAAATDRGIPHMRLNDGNLVQLGYGAMQQRIWTAETDHTSAIGESIASDKELTKSLLQSCGVPVPEGRVVADAEEAWEAAEDIGAQVEAVHRETRAAVDVVSRITTTLGAIAAAQDTVAAAVEQQRAATDRVVESVERAAGGSARITEAVAALADDQRETYVRRALAVAEDLLDEAGGVGLGDDRRRLTVRDQVTGATHVVDLPDLLLGGVPLTRDDDPRRPAPLVDDVVALVDGSCTLFQRLDADGSMVRAATTVVTAQGRRNIGTYIPRRAADGSPNPVLAAVLAGRTYTGEATVADRSYFTAYQGLHSADGELVGMLYVGLPLDALSG